MANAPFADDDPLDEAERLVAGARAGEAAALLGKLIDEGRGGLLARLAHARALLAAGDKTGAIASARETATLYSGSAEAALVLGETLLAAEQLPTAIAEFQRALRLDPAPDDARFMLGCAWLEAGEAERALQAFAELPPETPGLEGKIARARAMLARQRSDAGYVRYLFDQFSADYDVRMLTQLAYRAPQILKELADLTIPWLAGLAIIDLGCGTGLAGAAFKDRAARLDGIDLSPAMLDKAWERNIYDALTAGDFETGIGRETYDLVLAADTLVYLGDLDATMAVVATALKPGGHFLFTVESKEGEGFELGPKRRWRHSESYLRGLAGKCGLAVCGFLVCAPRHEAGTPVDGFAVALRKTS